MSDSKPTAPNIAIASLQRLHAAEISELEQDEASWIGPLRQDALDAFLAQGIPTRKLESWKGTNFARVESFDFEQVSTEEPNPVVVTGDGVPEFHFVDGRLDTATSQAANLPHGVRLLSLAEARRQAPEILEGRLGSLTDLKTEPFVALQTAFLDDGAVLSIDPGVELESPLRLRFSVRPRPGGAPSAAFPRLLVIAGENSRAALSIEHDTDASPETGSSAPGLTAFVAEFFLAEGARFETIQIQNEDPARVHFTSTHARVEENARFDSFVFTLGSGLTRSELGIELSGPNGESNLRGFFLGREDGHVDHYTTVDHAAESCRSDQEYRGVLGDNADGVFRGRVIIRPGAQKTDARQSNPNLLLSNRASIDTKPQLEIYADDVKATHGSTIGQLDADALFFLRARGISEGEAKIMLTRAFARSIVDGIESESIRATTATLVEAQLSTLGSTNTEKGADTNTDTANTANTAPDSGTKTP